MTTFAITNIQRRDVNGRFIGLHSDIEIDAPEADFEFLAVLVRDRIGGAGYPSFTFERGRLADAYK
jgi:hypothetical protein